MKRIMVAVAFALTLLLAGPAFAASCPMLMAQIDRQLETAELSEAEREEIKALREEGEAKHRAGGHAESVELLNQALAKLEEAE